MDKDGIGYDPLLLKHFNSRERYAFNQIYLMYFDDLIYFASNLFRNTATSPDDIVQDIFLNLWENKKQKFTGLINIKAYLFVSVKNRFKDYLKHQKHIDNHLAAARLNEDYFVFQVVETEVSSFLKEAVEVLPEECRKVFVEYINGLDANEIALKLNKSEFTVYKQRKTAIEILKNKFPKDKMLIIMFFLT